jgi:Zn-dependent protease
MFRRSGSIKLMDLFGFRVGVDASWFLILFLLIFLLSGPFRATLHSSDAVAYITTVVSVLLLFASLIVHELGHALVARRQGIEVKRIDLFLFGGLTQMSRDAVTPGEDFKIAVAGPLATVGVIAVCLAVDVALVGEHRLVHAIALDSGITITPVLLSLSLLLPMNVLLLVFNLVPAFPLDGGRIARSIIWRITGDKWRGTRISARLGQGFAVVLAGGGIWLLVSLHTLSGLWLIAMAYLLGQSARGAILQSTLTERIEGVRVADIMDAHPVAIPAALPVSQALDEYFLRYGYAWFPVVDESRRLIGIGREERAQASADGGEGWLTMAAIVESDGAASWRIEEDRPISEVLSSESLGRLGALMAVDRDGVLRGVVTVDQVRRALQSAFGRIAA